jgi:hypothetical protein
LLFVPGNTFRDKGPAGHDERIQRPASRFRFAKDGEMKIADLSGESGRAGIDRGEHEDHDQHSDHYDGDAATAQGSSIARWR